MAIDILNELTIQSQRLTKDEKLILASRLIAQVRNSKTPDIDDNVETKSNGSILQTKIQLAQKWLTEHENEFAGQYVALDGDQLIAHKKTGKEVLDEAHKAGVKPPFITRIDAPEDQPFGGW
jgi:hypothetical protein